MKSLITKFITTTYVICSITFTILVILRFSLGNLSLDNRITYFLFLLGIPFLKKVVDELELIDLIKRIITRLRQKYTATAHLVSQVIFTGSFGYLLLRSLVFELGLPGPFLLLKLLSFVNLAYLGFILAGFVLAMLTKEVGEDKYTEKSTGLKKYLLILVPLLAVGIMQRSHLLGSSNFRDDEFQVIDAAAGFLYTGDFRRWDWINDRPVCSEDLAACRYTRAWPHTSIIAMSYKLFGISEMTSRLPSLVFGVLLLAIAFPIARYFTTNKKASLLIAILFILNYDFFSLSRYVRMYALFVPIYLILSFLVMKVLMKLMRSKKMSGLGDLARFMWANKSLITMTLALLIVSYSLHINTLIILPIVYLLVMVHRRSANFGMVFRYGSMVLVAVALFIASGLFKYDVYFSLFKARNFLYLDSILGYPIYYQVCLVIIMLGLITALRTNIYAKLPNLGVKLSFLLLSVGVSLIFFIYIGNRYHSYVYTSHMVPLAIILIGWMTYVFSLNMSRNFRYILFLMMIIYSSISLTSKTVGAYKDLGEPKLDIGYAEINENYNPEEEVIFLQFSRRYYLRHLNQARLLDLGTRKSYSLDEFLREIQKYPKGYISWEHPKRGHLRDELIIYIRQNFEQLHGHGLDDIGVEVYYYDITNHE